ncbi:MAG: glycosyltransferase [Nitrososphaeria archaeon]
MKKVKKVSLYIPVLNQEKYLKRCLKGVLSQDYPISEIIIVDNGSTDSSIKIVNHFRRIDKRIKVVREKERGLANARNAALKAAKSTFIAAVDADCFLEKDWLSRIMANFSDRKIVGVGGKLVENDKWRAIHLKQEWGEEKLINPPFLFGSNTVFRTKVLKSVGGYNPIFKTNYEDVDMSRKLLSKNFKLVYEPKAVAHHMKVDKTFSLLRTVWAWGFYGNEPKNFADILKRVIFNIKMPSSLLFEDLINGRFTFILTDLLIFFSNPFFDLKYYVEYIKNRYF